MYPIEPFGLSMASDTIKLETYSIDKEIRQDDISIVYQGSRIGHNDPPRAIQIFAPQLTVDDSFRQQLSELIQPVTQLDHPNILPIYDFGQSDEGRIYITQALVEGVSLTKLLDSDGAFSSKRMLKIGRQIAAALDHAHQHHVVHGDLSADNIYVGHNDHVFVLDFTITQAMSGTRLVKQGYPVGSPETMAPERINGQPATPHTDLYALGIICYQMLTTKYPFEGTLLQLLYAHGYETPRPLNLLNPSVSAEMGQAIDKMLSKEATSRYQNGAEFVETLSTLLDEPIEPELKDVSVEVPTEKAAVFSPSFRKRHTSAKDAATRKMDRRQLPQRSRVQLWLGIGFVVVVLGVILSSGLGLASVWQISHVSQVEAAREPSQATGQSQPILAPTRASTATTAPTPKATNTPAIMPMSEFQQDSLPTLGPPVITIDSPFTNLRLARQIDDDDQPRGIATSFSLSNEPLYLFFDYEQVKPGGVWSHRWLWADSEVGNYQAVWEENLDSQGTAWVFFSPEGGYQSGPYQVNLALEGQTVATATFVIQP